MPAFSPLSDTFQRCILANQSNHSACDQYRQELSSCASEAVPLLATVKRKCQRQLQDYDLCLKQGEHDNDEQITSRCIAALRNLHLCTEAVRREERGMGNRSSSIGIRSVE